MLTEKKIKNKTKIRTSLTFIVQEVKVNQGEKNNAIGFEHCNTLT